MPVPRTALHELLTGLQGKPDPEKLEAVNMFFNSRIRYATDFDVWGVSEYWATPDELLDRGAGDCEDFALAKYFALIESGIDEALLKIVYAWLLATDEAHMVLAYDDTLILDNRIDEIMPMGGRSDLLPIMGFNRAGLWRYYRGESKLLTWKWGKLTRWRGLLARVKEGGS
jgi:predicted transglutaminase-like cysteine proteinase